MPDPIKLICFDLNKTLIQDNSWLNLNLAMGISEKEDNRILNLYGSGQISYQEGQNILLEKYKQSSNSARSKIIEILKNYSYLSGSQSIIKYLQSKNYEICLISGAMNILVELVAKELSIKYFAAVNKFIFDKANRLVAIKSLGDENTAKVKLLANICSQLSINITNCACVGDGANDIDLFQTTKHGITFTGSEIKDYAWRVINNLEDLKNIF